MTVTASLQSVQTLLLFRKATLRLQAAGAAAQSCLAQSIQRDSDFIYDHTAHTTVDLTTKQYI